MPYTLDTVKYLFDKYNIKRNVAGQIFVVERANNKPVLMASDDINQKHLVDWVEFAHTWYLARQNNRSSSSLDMGITKEKYQKAFDAQAKSIYDHLMTILIKSVQESGSFLSREDLAKKIQKETNIAHASSTIFGLYANSNRELSFKKWVIDATFSKNESVQQSYISR